MLWKKEHRTYQRYPAKKERTAIINWHSIFRKQLALLHLPIMTKINILSAKELWAYNCLNSRDRLVVRTLRCGRSNPGSNSGHGMLTSIFCSMGMHEKKKKNCVGRESNPDQLLGRQLCWPLYHRRWQE